MESRKVSSMELTITEFPFVAEIPKREKTKVAKIWDQFQELARVQKEHGIVISQTMASKMLNISSQRVGQFLDEGRLQFVEMDGIRFVTEKSIIEFAKMERKNGRPPGRIEEAAGKGNVALAQEAFRCAKEVLEEQKAERVKQSKK
jgi:hypothetical protein